MDLVQTSTLVRLVVTLPSLPSTFLLITTSALCSFSPSHPFSSTYSRVSTLLTYLSRSHRMSFFLSLFRLYVVKINQSFLFPDHSSHVGLSHFGDRPTSWKGSKDKVEKLSNPFLSFRPLTTNSSPQAVDTVSVKVYYDTAPDHLVDSNKAPHAFLALFSLVLT